MYGLWRKTSAAFIYATAIFLLILAGIGYRIWGSRLKLQGKDPIMLSIPLSNFPRQFGNWVGNDIDIPATAREYMEKNFADDFFSRRYINSVEQIWADIYVVYCSTRPGGILGHRPGVCYPAHGWLQETSETSQFATQNGRQIKCLVQKFRKPTPSLDEVVVLSFYVRNGLTTTGESDFSGLSGRKFNLARDPTQYVAQVQISSVLESSAMKSAQKAADIVLDFLPDKNGKTRTTEYVGAEIAIVK